MRSATLATSGSSSTIRMVASLRQPGAAASPFGSSRTAGRSQAGRRTVNVVPVSGRLSTRSQPWWLFTMPRVAASPRPRPVVFVVKKGSKMRASTASLMPRPLSVTRRATKRPPRQGGSPSQPPPSAAPSETASLSTTIEPSRSPIASAAFKTRFITTCRSCDASPVTASSRSANRQESVICFGTETAIRSIMSHTTRETSRSVTSSRPLPA
jgi:hypothetical protein